MKKLFALFLFIVYTGFVTGPLYANSVFARYVCKESSKCNNEISEPEPGKDIDAPHFTRISKKLPGKLKVPKAQVFRFKINKLTEGKASGFQKPTAFCLLSYPIDSTPLFLRNRVFRI